MDKEPLKVIEIAMKVLEPRAKSEFGLWAVSQIAHILEDSRSIQALSSKRDWLDGKISDDELWDGPHQEARKAYDDAENQEPRVERASAAAWSISFYSNQMDIDNYLAAKEAAQASGDIEAARKSQADWLLEHYRDEIHKAFVEEAFGLLGEKS